MLREGKSFSKSKALFSVWACLCVSCSQENVSRNEPIRRNFCMSEPELVFLLLSQPELQNELSLRSDQVSGVDALVKQDWKTIPSVTGLLAQARTNNNVNKRVEVQLQAIKQAEEYRLLSLTNVLDSRQMGRLWQVVRQTEGLVSLCEEAVILDLTKAQQGEIHLICKTYGQKLAEPLRRLGRQHIAGLAPDETLEKREQEIRQLQNKIQSLENTRDEKLFRILTTVQKQKWKVLLGDPLVIDWSNKGGKPVPLIGTNRGSK